MRSYVALAAILSSFAAGANFSGPAAFDFAQHAVAFGPRPSGSDANRKLQAYIAAQLKLDGCEVTDDAFVADTPIGKVPMKNIIAKFPGKSGRAIAVTGHFDTKYFPGRHFVGANDGGSSTGLLLELARAEAHQQRVDDLYIVFFDGEEAFGEWTATDSIYGSRHLAERWRKDGTLARLKAMILVDMIGDKNLNVQQEGNSDLALRRLVWSTAADLGYHAYFVDEPLGPIEDDHLPFRKLGVPVIDLIDFDYPPWHKDTDTIDKISGQSLEIVGTVVMETIHRLER
ncbi:MAG TPA: M28 family peptidase [Bryobacteraceae bacterium]|nr:M28 family peptidase [Bryobacteraceae bacterium]